jgi:hypothetical protein
VYILLLQSKNSLRRVRAPQKLESPPILLVVQTGFLVARAKRQAPKTKRAGRNLRRSPLFVSAKRRGGKGITGLERRKPAFRKEEPPPFLTRRMIICPAMGPLGHTWFSLFAEPTDNENFSERKSIFVSTELEMIKTPTEMKGKGQISNCLLQNTYFPEILQ